ncbi:MAG: response regulator [Flavobacterium sp.]|nr:response regulator [Flavobacterium sp.]
MAQLVRVLMVDDHPFIIEAYKNAIKGYNTKGLYEFTVTQAKDCKTGYEAIINEDNAQFDIAFFDLSMPTYEEKGISSGEDLALLVKERLPACKIILLTMHSEMLKINTIIKNINPNGLVIKNDLTFDELLLAFDKILKDENYYSQTVVKLVSQIPFDSNEVDVFDKQLLFHLSKGVPTADLAQFVPLADAVIEKRLTNLKAVLDIPQATHSELVQEAKNKGVI